MIPQLTDSIEKIIDMPDPTFLSNSFDRRFEQSLIFNVLIDFVFLVFRYLQSSRINNFVKSEIELALPNQCYLLSKFSNTDFPVNTFSGLNGIVL